MSDLKIEIVPIEKIQPYELNAKIHDEQQVNRIAESIKQFGFDQPIVVDKNYVIIKGHGRRLASIKLGIERVPVLVRDDLTEEQVRASRLSDNRVAIGDIDGEIFQQELSSLDYSLDGIFDSKELDFFSFDMAEMNLDAIVEDISKEVAEQEKQTASKIEEMNTKAVKIDKALGFSTIQGKDEKIIARFMALAEGETELEGSDAFVAYLKTIVSG